MSEFLPLVALSALDLPVSYYKQSTFVREMFFSPERTHVFPEFIFKKFLLKREKANNKRFPDQLSIIINGIGDFLPINYNTRILPTNSDEYYLVIIETEYELLASFDIEISFSDKNFSCIFIVGLFDIGLRNHVIKEIEEHGLSESHHKLLQPIYLKDYVQQLYFTNLSFSIIGLGEYKIDHPSPNFWAHFIIVETPEIEKINAISICFNRLGEVYQVKDLKLLCKYVLRIKMRTKGIIIPLYWTDKVGKNSLLSSEVAKHGLCLSRIDSFKIILSCENQETINDLKIWAVHREHPKLPGSATIQPQQPEILPRKNIDNNCYPPKNNIKKNISRRCAKYILDTEFFYQH